MQVHTFYININVVVLLSCIVNPVLMRFVCLCSLNDLILGLTSDLNSMVDKTWSCYLSTTLVLGLIVIKEDKMKNS